MPEVVDRKDVVVLCAAAASAAWAAAIFLTPVQPFAAGRVAALPYLIGSLVCHQIPERSFHLAGAQLPVCARCTGLYLGAAVGLSTWVAGRVRRSVTLLRPRALFALALSGVPTAFTVATAWLGVGDPPNAWRAALAVPLGAVAGYVVGAVVTDHLK